jgi:hypothetical protein
MAVEIEVVGNGDKADTMRIPDYRNICSVYLGDI